MDAAIGLMFALLMLSAFGFGLAVLYKNRVAVNKWLNAPYHAEEDRRLRLQRELEDTQKELDDIERRDSN